MPEVEITTGEDSTAEDERPLRRRSLLRYSLLGGINVALIAVVALFFSWRGESKPEDAAPPPPIDVLATIATGDNLQLAGKPQEAMDLYRLVAAAPASKKTSLTYRMALCAEQLGEFNDALDLFNAAAQHPAVEVSIAARLGSARVHHSKGDFDLSERALAQLAATSALPSYSVSGVGSEIDFLLAFTCADRSLARQTPSIRDKEHCFKPELPRSIHRLLQLVPLEGNHLGMPTPIGDDTHFGFKLHGPARTPATTLLSVGLRNQQLSSVLERLSAATSWKITPSPRAAEIISAKRIDAHLRDKTVAELLSLMFGPQGLFWTFEDGSLNIDRVENVSQATLVERQNKRANDLLQNVLAEHPSHVLAPYAYLALGNLSVLSGKLDRARTFYREINERFHGHAVRQAADYNLAKVWYTLEDYDQATDLFHQVVDARQGSELKPASYMYVGRIYLERGDLTKAKRALSRSLATARQTDVVATASLTLASVYLMKGDAGAAEAANAVLMENREALTDPSYLNKAVFMSSLTRYHAAFRPGDVHRRARELTSALMRVDPSSFFGEFGYLLVADAFAEVGVPLEAMRLYIEALSRPLSALMRDKLMFRLATEYRKQTEHALAREIYLDLAVSKSKIWAPLASIELADMLQQNDEAAACIKHCRWALEQGYSEEHNAELLGRLGRVYESLGDHQSAGYCFAGFLPADKLRIAEAP